MSTEAAFITALRALATSSAARQLADDAAVLEIGGTRLVLTMDSIVEGVHFLSADPPETVAWKLVATNVSDLAAKGAVPRGCLLSYALSTADEWNAAFLRGLRLACETYSIPLLGGDTVRQPNGSARSFSLVALGEPAAGVEVPSRGGACVGDELWVTGSLGDAGLGLGILRGEHKAQSADRDTLVSRYRTPMPDVSLGVALAPLVHAMMDVSDGVLIDAGRLAAASGLAAVVELDRLPLSDEYMSSLGCTLTSCLFAATAGDDYCLLFAAPPRIRDDLIAAAKEQAQKLHCIGRITEGEGLVLLFDGQIIPPPARLGYEH
ncbi:thiamine-phosphate kinase [Novosphingobium sp. RD2P27]|uniref:Thiamine-monophosphate kinase n=1 Tax=Novosphingobium kalidii TaxID=3230299 RepID=A0ABV2CZ76_9SPHN